MLINNSVLGAFTSRNKNILYITLVRDEHFSTLICIKYNIIIICSTYLSNYVNANSVFKVHPVLLPMAEHVLVVQIRQRGAADQPVGGHRSHPM